MHETRTGVVTLKGNPMTLEGKGVEVGQKAPDFTVTGTDMKPISLSDYRGKTVVISSVPSIDTPVCSTETRTFNERAADISQDIVILTISVDLPMAQSRWCAAEGVDRVVMGSDYKDRSFAEAFGLRMAENGLLARAVYVVDADGVVRYEQIVPEIASEPDYDAALKAARDAAG